MVDASILNKWGHPVVFLINLFRSSGMKSIRLFLPAVIVTAVLSGCYTQFVMVDKTPPKEEVSWVVDSATGDTVKVIKQTDTVETQNNQTCIWVRDLMGYPYLRCYDSFYPRDWFYYNYSPWWYYDYPYYSRALLGIVRTGGYYSGGYYYGGRRYYRHRRYDENTEPSKTEPAGPSGSSYRSRVRGVPNPKAEGVPHRSGSTVRTVGSKQNATTQSSEPTKGEIIIPKESGKQPVIIQDRSRGVPSEGATAAPVHKENVAPTQSKSAEVHSSTPPPANKAPSSSATTPSRKSSQKSSQQSNGEQKGPHLRKARRW